jgi:hypothetical protein
MKASKANSFINKVKDINGWFSLEAVMLFAWIDEIQKSNGMTGDIFEIGVHHGKSAAILGAMIEPGREKLGVCDIFDNQEANVSASGCGNRLIFEDNMESLLPDRLKDIKVYPKLSSDLTPEEIGTNYRFFHIDGGHNWDEALLDLELATHCTIDGGVIAIDDAINQEWLGVTEAIYRFLDKNPDYTSLVLGFNKMLLVKKGYAEMYQTAIDDMKQRVEFNILYPWHLKTIDFANQPLRIFFVPVDLNGQWMRHALARFYQKHEVMQGDFLKPLVSAVNTIIPRKG